MKLKMISGGKRLLFFYEPRRPSDLRVVERQMTGRKFAPALILGTANRCRWGCPRVVVCSPLKSATFHKGGDAQCRGFVPFPTSFWLTCPWLTRFIGTVESGGGVGELEQWLRAQQKHPDNQKRQNHQIHLFDMDHRLARMALLSPSRLNFLRRFKPKVFDRLRRGGVGGIRHDDSVRVKCIHLQAASWLALRRHPGEEWLKERDIGQECDGSSRCVYNRKTPSSATDLYRSVAFWLVF